MSGRHFRRLATVMRSGNDLTVFHDQSPHRNFIDGQGFMSFFERQAHDRVVIHGIKRLPHMKAPLKAAVFRP